MCGISNAEGDTASYMILEVLRQTVGSDLCETVLVQNLNKNTRGCNTGSDWRTMDE